MSSKRLDIFKICSRCVLPDTFPGITFDSHGVCHHCRNYSGNGAYGSEERKLQSKAYFEQLLGRLDRPDLRNCRSYDILMAYSGGKDSTYTMSLLRNKYNLRILALSFDNGFLSETALANIRSVTDKLGVDHLLFKPRWEVLKKIFRTASERELFPHKTLERASTVCTSCMGIVKSLCLRISIEMHIPMVGYGWSPGQAPVQASIMKTNPAFTRAAQQTVLDPLREIAGNEIEDYFLQDRHYADPGKFPYNIHPMAWEYYNEEMILHEIRALGWTAPDDTDSNSTNCLLNAFANEGHIRKYRFHPYVWEIANMVREGIMRREEGYKKIYADQPAQLVENARRKLEA